MSTFIGPTSGEEYQICCGARLGEWHTPWCAQRWRDQLVRANAARAEKPQECPRAYEPCVRQGECYAQALGAPEVCSGLAEPKTVGGGG